MNDYIIAEECVDDFRQKLHHPDPKRVKVRRETLKKARKIYFKYVDKLRYH